MPSPWLVRVVRYCHELWIWVIERHLFNVLLLMCLRSFHRLPPLYGEAGGAVGKELAPGGLGASNGLNPNISPAPCEPAPLLTGVGRFTVVRWIIRRASASAEPDPGN